jgi:hypothetical protein
MLSLDHCCALQMATIEVGGRAEHRGAALQDFITSCSASSFSKIVISKKLFSTWR